MPAIPFPRSSTPGRAPGEDMGRLVNCYVEPNGDGLLWKRGAGLQRFTTVGEGGFRGMMERPPFLYVVAGERCYAVSPNGTATRLGGHLPGSGRVTIARNNRAPSQMVIVSEYGAYIVDLNVIRVYPSPNLPLVNSVSFLGGFFIFTTPSGQIWASGLNDTATSLLSFATAESNPDGLLRGAVAGQQFYAFGTKTTEVWQNVGSFPFPLARVHVSNIGLAGPWAVAGFEEGWDLPIVFVASDGTVRAMDGYSAQVISTPPVERSIASVTDKTQLEASVYTFAGNSFWVISGPSFSWEFNFRTQAWNERTSVGLDRWRNRFASRHGEYWVSASYDEPYLYRLGDYHMEDDEALIWGADSIPVKSFPIRSAVASAELDFPLGRGSVVGEDPIGFDPKVMISWSHDGGATWAHPLERELGQQGRYVGPVRVNRLGLASHHGFRLRWRVSDPVYTSFAGAFATGSPRAA